jgi:hypothetical protein
MQFPFFAAKLSIDGDDSINFHENVNRPSGYSNLFSKIRMPTHRIGYLSTMELMGAKFTPLDNGEPAERLKIHRPRIWQMPDQTNYGLNSEYLARPETYRQVPKNCGYDPHILRGHLWGERFQMSVTGERQVTGGSGRSFSGQ